MVIIHVRQMERRLCWLRAKTVCLYILVLFWHVTPSQSFRTYFVMFHKRFPPLNGKRTDVVITDGLPELSMSIILEVFRDPPEDEHAAYVFIADFLKRLLDDERDGLVDMVARLNKTVEETYVDGLVDSAGYAVQRLNESAVVIQRRWRSYRSRAAAAPRDDDATCDGLVEDDGVRTAAGTTAEGNATEISNGYGGVSTNAATLIQRAWRRRRRFDDAVRTSGPPAADGRSSRERLADEPTDDGRECGDDESDDAERVNVVGKGHGDYVPPVPDFVRGTYSSAAERSSGSKYGGEDDDSSERLV